MTQDLAEVAGGFERVLNRHGYGFQYAVLRKARLLFEKKQSVWRFEVSEFPVTTQHDSTRIDFVLKAGSKETPILMIVECKRANPALANWCFIHAPAVHARQLDGRFILERGTVSYVHPTAGGGSMWPP